MCKVVSAGFAGNSVNLHMILVDHKKEKAEGPGIFEKEWKSVNYDLRLISLALKKPHL